jgi:hypothetical protein
MSDAILMHHFYKNEESDMFLYTPDGKRFAPFRLSIRRKRAHPPEYYTGKDFSYSTNPVIGPRAPCDHLGNDLEASSTALAQQENNNGN